MECIFQTFMGANCLYLERRSAAPYRFDLDFDSSIYLVGFLPDRIDKLRLQWLCRTLLKIILPCTLCDI